VYAGFPACYFSSEMCVACGIRPACCPALLKIQRRLTGETIAVKPLAAFWMRLLAFTLLVMIAGVLLIERKTPHKPASAATTSNPLAL